MDQEPSSSPLARISPSTSSINVANFIPTKLQWLPNIPGTNYETWKKQMLCLMKSQGLMKYIDGTIALPLSQNQDYNIWETNNAFVEGWILGSLSDQIASTVLQLDSAKDIWFSLEEKFGGPQTTSADSMFSTHTSKTISSSMDPEPSSFHLASISPSTSSINVRNFIPMELQWLPNDRDTNYKIWKKGMLCLMESQGLMDYIDITVSQLPLRSSEEYDIWKKNDALVKGWIIGSLSDQIASTVLESDSAKDIWFSLEEKFGGPQTTPAYGENARKDSGIPLVLAIVNSDWKAAKQIMKNVDRIQKSSAAEEEDMSEIEIHNIETSSELNNVSIQMPWDQDSVETISEATDDEDLSNFTLSDIPDEIIAFRNDREASVLHIAAAVGKVEAAHSLVSRMPDLYNIQDNDGDFPIQYAARCAQRKMLEHLMVVTPGDKKPNPFADLPGLRLLTHAIDAEFFDIAINLVKKYPELAVLRSEDNDPALVKLVGRSVLGNRRRFNFWQKFIAFVFHNQSSLENPGPSGCKPLPGVVPFLQSYFTKFFKESCLAPVGNFTKFLKESYLIPLVPGISTIITKAKAHDDAHELLKLLCKKLKLSKNSWEAQTIIENAIVKVGELGVKDVAELVMGEVPLTKYAYRLPIWQSIFREAVENRSEGVVNIIYKINDHKHIYISNNKDRHGNNLLHLAGKLAPAHKLNMISGAVLQMQRELQWFKEVEKLFPFAREKKNYAGKTPQQMFTDEHKVLKEAGENWMKETANSCTISAALIATVMFAAAITVPGGNHQDTGYPMFSHDAVFIIFAVSDAISLFTSVTSLLLFLAILTSRYAEEDFLRVLPKRLIFGLAALFLSITFMMISFSATLYLVFERKKAWVLAPILVFASLPVTSFVLLQFPLLIDLISCTYFPSAFGKKRSRPFY